jgi:hypothetical protein
MHSGQDQFHAELPWDNSAATGEPYLSYISPNPPRGGQTLQSSTSVLPRTKKNRNSSPLFLSDPAENPAGPKWKHPAAAKRIHSAAAVFSFYYRMKKK